MVDIADAQAQRHPAPDNPDGRTIDGRVVLGGIWTPLNSNENLVSDTNSIGTKEETVIRAESKTSEIAVKTMGMGKDFQSMAIKLNSAKFDHISPANKAALLAKFGGKTNSLQLDPKFLLRGRMKRGDYVKPKRQAPRPDIVRDIL